MNINDLQNIKKQFGKKVIYGHSIINNAIKRMDSVTIQKSNLFSREHSIITTLGKAKQFFTKKYHFYSRKIRPKDSTYDLTYFTLIDKLDFYKNTMLKLQHLISQKYPILTAILLKPTITIVDAQKGRYINVNSPIVLTKSVLFNIISKYGFITAHQLESDFVKAMHKLPEESAMSVKKKVNLSRHYLAIKAAVPDNAIFNISSLLKGNDSTASLMQSASFVYTDIREAIPYIQKESKKANQLLHDIKTIINKQIDGQSTYMMFETTQLELNEKYMKMDHKQLAKLIRKNKLV